MLWTTPLDTLRKHLIRHWAWIAWAAGVLFALRILALGASCALDSSQTCADWFLYGLFAPLRFQWVFKYKELIAGLLAVGGGTFAYFAATATIAAHENRQNAERIQKIQIARASVLKSLTDIVQTFLYDSPINDDYRVNLARSTELLCHASVDTFGKIMINLGRIDQNLHQLSIAKQQSQIDQLRKAALRDAMMITAFLTHAKNWEDPADTLPKSIPGKEMLDLMRSENLGEPDPSESLAELFDFTR